MKWKYVNEWLTGKALEGASHGLFAGTRPVLPEETEENHTNPQL